MSTTNNREYFRIGLQIPLSAQLKIVGINNILVDTKHADICITDISVGGLRVHSKLDLPLNFELLLEFSFSLFHKEMKILGTIVRKSNLSSAMYEYGIRFSLNDNQHKLLLSNLNLLSIRLRHSNILSSCSFCSEEEMNTFYSAN